MILQKKKSRWPTTTKIRDSKTTRWAVRLTRGWPKVTMCVESRRRVVSVSSASSKARDKNGKKLLDRKVEEVRKKERGKNGLSFQSSHLLRMGISLFLDVVVVVVVVLAIFRETIGSSLMSAILVRCRAPLILPNSFLFSLLKKMFM